MRVVASYSMKGGVGKTTTAVNLAAAAAASGLRTLLWDLDPQAAATYHFRVAPRVKGGARRLLRRKGALARAIKGTDYVGLDLVPAGLSYRHLEAVLLAGKARKRRLGRVLGEMIGDYDRVVLDCAPGLSLVAENALRASDAVLVPINPHRLSLRTYDQLLEFVSGRRMGGVRLWPFFTLVGTRNRAHRALVEQWGEEHPECLDTVIPRSLVVERMAVDRSPVVGVAGRSAVARAYVALDEEVEGRLRALE